MTQHRDTIGIFLGRFQPFHTGHLSVVEDILEKYEYLTIMIGSAEKSRTSENPWTYAERVDIIRANIPQKYQGRIHIVGLDDVPSDDDWVADLKKVFVTCPLLSYPLDQPIILPPLKGGQENQNERSQVPSPPFKGGKNQNKQGGMQPEKYGYAEYNYPINTKLTLFSDQMSRQMTRAEQRLWFEVLAHKKTGYKWVKQKIIGNFIVDFYCHEKHLIIEVDGGVHIEQQEYDFHRTRFLESMGIRVIRFNNELIIGQIETVRDSILRELATLGEPVPLSRGVEESVDKGGITLFTGNPWVRDICERQGIKTTWVIPRIQVSGTEIREKLKRGEIVSAYTVVKSLPLISG